MSRHSPLFVHLRVHTAYSLLEGALRTGRLAQMCLDYGMPAVAVTDRNNLFGALEFSKIIAGAGIQPILGCTLAVDFADQETTGVRRRQVLTHYPSLALIARNETGYANLMKLTSAAFLEVDSSDPPHVGLDRLARYSDGLICLSGGPEGPLDEALALQQGEQAFSRCTALKEIYGDGLYVEIQRHDTEQERQVEPALIKLAYALDLPLVATNQAFFESEEDWEAHDALICIAEGVPVATSERRRLTRNHGFRSGEEMTRLFADLPEAIENTIEIARRCAYRPLTTDRPSLPSYGVENEAEELRRQAVEGLEKRLADHGTAPGFDVEDYHRQLAHELDIIISMDFPGYFLIVADFIKWANRHGIPVGPGRGSGAGSVVAWALTITGLDPLRFGLLFERFLNPERVSMPDFDIDFCQDRREEVIQYVQDKYGHDHVAQIITFGKLQARAVLRDVGRVLQIPYGKVDQLCKLVPNNPAKPVSLARAIEGEPKLREARDEDETVARMLEIGQRLEGLYRHASTHAAGLVIGDRPLEETVPLYRDPRSTMPVTQYNMKWVEPAGLVKFDFLGLKTLTVISTACALLARRGIKVDPATIPFEDEKTYEMMARGDTIGVFQFESAGMRSLMRQAEPGVFEDLIAIVALFRPGPMENIPKYLACKHGEEKPEILHEMIEPVVKDTYGVIIYQEQVMQIAQVLSGYSLGEADLLRRAMGKKIAAEMEAQRSRFVEGAVANGVDAARADYIFNMVDKFAGYGFNKSHSAAYALVAYQTAWLKANYPHEFLAASMTLDMTNTDKLSVFCQEAQRLGIEVVPPSVNRSEVDFTVEDGRIIYALAAIRNVGRQAARTIVEARAEGGAFESFGDFAARIDPHQVNRRALEHMIRAGAFDGLEPNRARVLKSVERILATASRMTEDRQSGQNDLFGDAGTPRLPLAECEPWMPMERLSQEYEAVGFYLSGHPLDAYSEALAQLDIPSWGEFAADVREKGARAGRLAGTVTYRNDRVSPKNGNKYAFIGISDPSGQYEVMVFAETLAEAGAILAPGQAVVVRLEAEYVDEEIKLRLNGVRPLEEVVANLQREMSVFIRDEAPLQSLKHRLEAHVTTGSGARPVAGRPGQVQIIVLLDEGKREVELRLPGMYRVNADIAGALRDIPGVVDVHLFGGNGR